MIKEHLDTQLSDEKANHRKKVFQLDTQNEQMREKKKAFCMPFYVLVVSYVMKCGFDYF